MGGEGDGGNDTVGRGLLEYLHDPIDLGLDLICRDSVVGCRLSERVSKAILVDAARILFGAELQRAVRARHAAAPPGA